MSQLAPVSAMNGFQRCTWYLAWYEDTISQSVAWSFFFYPCPRVGQLSLRPCPPPFASPRLASHQEANQLHYL